MEERQTAVREEGISRTKLVNYLLISFIIIAIIFAIIFWLGYSPRDLYYTVAPVTASKDRPPKFLFAFYGEGEGKMEKPMDVAVFRDRVYVSDAEKNQILVFNLDGKFKFAFGRAGNGPGEFNFPYGLAVDKDGRLYVADMKNHRLQVFDRDGKFVGFFPGEGKAKVLFSSPAALTIKNNLLYVTDVYLCKVFVFDLEGSKVLEFGERGSEKGQFKYPNGVEADSKGNIYVADSGNNRVQVFDREGKFRRQFDGTGKGIKVGYASPRGMYLFDDEILLTMANMSSQLWATDLKGQVYYRFGTKGDQNEDFFYPNGITMDKNRLYIADSGNHGVKVYSY